jgi:hypothetical protein
MFDKRPKIVVMPSASQISGSSGAMSRDRFLCQCIKFAGTRITFNGRVELIGVKRFEPSTKSGQLPGRQLLDGLFDVFGCCHSRNITPVGGSEKTVSVGVKIP